MMWAFDVQTYKLTYVKGTATVIWDRQLLNSSNVATGIHKLEEAGHKVSGGCQATLDYSAYRMLMLVRPDF